MADESRPPMPGAMPSSFDGNQDFYNERPGQKIIRKIKEEPVVPIGMALTSFAFIGAYRALRRGDSKQANRMFRARVLAQGLTVLAMVAGSMYYSQDREKTKELRKLQGEKDAEEKRQKWIQELEARDDEDKRLRNNLKQKVLQRQAASDEGANTMGEKKSSGSGGVLGQMGLWSIGEQKAKELKEQVEEVKDEVEKKGRKENPKSSLKDLGEIMGRKKSSGDESSKK